MHAAGAAEPAWRRLYKPDADKFDEPFVWDVAGRSMTVHQAYAWASVDTVGLTVWDASLVLAKYIEHTLGPSGLAGKRAIELGSGCGVTGIAAAYLGADTVVSDWELVMPLLTRNVLQNAATATGALSARKLKWCGMSVSVSRSCRRTSVVSSAKAHASLTLLRGEDVSDLGTFDVILGADLLYQSHAIVPLLRTMWTLAKPEALVLMSYEKHNEVPDQFWAHVRNYFNVTQIPTTQLHPVYHHPKIDVFQLERLAHIVVPPPDQ